MSTPKKNQVEQVRRSPEKTRQKLLKAATRLFSKRGFDGVSVDQIVASAGVNKRMVYHYFGSKDGLYLAVLKDVFQRLAVLEVSATSEKEDPATAIATILETYFLFLKENPEFVTLLSWENLHQGRFIRKHPELLSKDPILQRLDRTVRDGIARGIFREGIDVRHLLISLISLCFVYFANRFTLSQSVGIDLESPKTLRTGIDHAIELVLKGLKA